MSPFNFILVNSCSKSPKKVPNLLKFLNLGPYEKLDRSLQNSVQFQDFKFIMTLLFPM